MPGGASTDRGAGEPAERGVLFADVSDSTRFYGELGDAGARALILASLGLVRASVEGAGGLVVEQIGDELFCLFTSASAAALAALAIHEGVDAARSAGALPASLRIRVGFHFGPVMIDGDHVFGQAVHIAHRVASTAKGGQAVTTGDTVARLDPLDATSRLLERTTLRGVSDPVELYEVLRGVGDTIEFNDRPQRSEEALAGVDRELILRCGDEVVILGPGRPSLTLGRDHGCDLVVERKGVSRLHARLERRKGAFSVVDLSTNGSTVVPEQGSSVFLRRGEHELAGRGQLVLGPNDGEVGEPALSYEVRDL